jgi:hypothetical protein
VSRSGIPELIIFVTRNWCIEVIITIEYGTIVRRRLKMYQYNDEDAAWRRLQDLQREMENSRLMANRPEAVMGMLRKFAARAWLLAGLAAARPPRRHVPRHES